MLEKGAVNTHDDNVIREALNIMLLYQKTSISICTVFLWIRRHASEPMAWTSKVFFKDFE